MKIHNESNFDLVNTFQVIVLDMTLSKLGILVYYHQRKKNISWNSEFNTSNSRTC